MSIYKQQTTDFVGSESDHKWPILGSSTGKCCISSGYHLEFLISYEARCNARQYRNHSGNHYWRPVASGWRALLAPLVRILYFLIIATAYKVLIWKTKQILLEFLSAFSYSIPYSYLLDPLPRWVMLVTLLNEMAVLSLKKIVCITWVLTQNLNEKCPFYTRANGCLPKPGQW